MKILVFGGAGMVGSNFLNLFKQKYQIVAPDIAKIDILNKDQFKKVIEELNPDTIINFAAYTNVEEAEKQTNDKNGICYQVNVVGVQNVAEVARDFNKQIIHISTEYIFDGVKADSPYTEEDKPNPINWYGQTKYFGEQAVLQVGGKVLVMRICMPYTDYYELKKDVTRFFLNELQTGHEIKAISDQKITPTLVNDISNALAVFVDHQTTGLYHVSVKGFTTPFEFAKLIAQEFNLNSVLVKPVTFEEYNAKKLAKLLKYSWLDSSKFRKEFGEEILHNLPDSLKMFKSGLTSGS